MAGLKLILWIGRIMNNGRMRSPEVNLIIAFFLRRASNDSIAKFEEMSKAVGFNVRNKRYRLNKAIQILTEEHNIILKSVKDVGYRFVSQRTVAEIVALRRQSRIKSQTDRWDMEMQTVNLQSLSQVELQTYLKNESKLVVQKLVNSESSQKQIEAMQRNNPPQQFTGTEFVREAIAALQDVS